MDSCSGKQAKLAVVIASKGRRETLMAWRRYLATQSRAADRVIWSVSSEADVPTQVEGDPDVLIGTAGLAAQRNRAIAELARDIDLVAFFDDDYVPSATCFDDIMAAFRECPDAIAMTGLLLADGAQGPGLSAEEAEDLLRDERPPNLSRAAAYCPTSTLYGCNMVVRRSALLSETFDENLPLYGWLEDADLSRRLLRLGKLYRTDRFTGVHRGQKSARSSGRQFGYSQIANPIYLHRKGVISRSEVLKHAARAVAVNAARSLASEPWIDRPGRLRGNLHALIDTVTGAVDPLKITDFA